MPVSKSRIIDYYDSCEIDYHWLWDLKNSRAMHYGFWDAEVSSLGQALLRQNDFMAERAAIDSEDRVLDAGCGVGGSALHLARRVGCHVTGISISARQIARATEFAREEELTDKTEFLERDFTDTGFPDEHFSVVWAVESVCHARDKMDFLREAFRVLRPGGRLIVCDGFASRRNYSEPEERLMRRWVNGWAVESLESDEAFCDGARDIGFQNIHYEDITTNIMPSARRLYRLAMPTLFFGRLAQLLRIRSSVQTQNIVAARDQYRALRRKLWHYGIFYGEKPRATRPA
ncbi:MAG: methyltransferase domain-containing protein [bacterium]|nr:methyltransferase domain-containing protein [bacterium]